MKKERRKRVVVPFVVLTFCMTLLIPFSCQDRHESSPQIDAQENTSEFFVNEDMAKTVAENFMQKTNPSLKSTKNYKLKKIKDEIGEELLYVINFDEGGFIIMPADNRIKPVLAFSETSYFETKDVEKKNGVGLWVSETKAGMKELKKSKKPQSEVMKELWKKHLTYFSLKDDDDNPPEPCEETTTTRGPLISTTWGQGNGYNEDCPTEADLELECGCNCTLDLDQDGKAYAGCVAVAMAQVMKYHEHPNTYSWDLMPNGVGNSYISELIADIGSSMLPKYYYNCNGSGLLVDDVGEIDDAFEDDFGYSTSATVAGYSYNDYQDVRMQIISEQPVIFLANNATGGHAWVCDGWREMIVCIGSTAYVYRYLHFNWGEYGAGDGFFSYDDFDGYTNNKHIVKGIKP